MWMHVRSFFLCVRLWMHISSTKMWRSSLSAWKTGEKVEAVNEMTVVYKRIPGSPRWRPCVPHWLYCSTFYRLHLRQYSIYFDLINSQEPCMHVNLRVIYDIFMFIFLKKKQWMLTKRENKQTFELFYMLILTTNFGLRIISMMKRASMTLSIMLRTPLRPSELCWLAQTCRSHHDEVSRKIKK